MCNLLSHTLNVASVVTLAQAMMSLECVLLYHIVIVGLFLVVLYGRFRRYSSANLHPRLMKKTNHAVTDFPLDP
jgi:hypothetical protein